jgi:uncharacterized protein YndB with AHSA1/START domain
MESNLTLAIKRTYKAKREKVFAAFTKPELLKQWFAPDGLVTILTEASEQVGGAYRIEMQDHEGTEITLTGRYIEYIENEKLVFSWAWKSAPEEQMTVTVLFKDTDQGTDVFIEQMGIPDASSHRNHQIGWNSGLKNLTAMLEKI